MVNVVPYMYNTEKVAAADVPNSALDFLKPQFDGKIVTPYPADDDVTLWVFYHIVEKYGWGYMDKYMAAKPNFIQGHLGQQRSIGTGQNLVTFDSIFDITDVLKRQGMPVNSHFPTVDAMPIWPLIGRDLQGRAASERGEAVPLLALAPEQQAKLPTWSPRSDVPPPAGYQADLLLQGRQRLSRLPHRPDASRGAAQTLRRLYRADRQCRRRAVSGNRSLSGYADFTRLAARAWRARSPAIALRPVANPHTSSRPQFDLSIHAIRPIGRLMRS